MSFTIGKTKYTVTFLFCALSACLIAFDKQLIFKTFLMVCAHEGAHLFAMKGCGIQVDAVSLEPFGIIIKKTGSAKTLPRRLLIICAGCAANLCLAVLFFLLYVLWQKSVFLHLSAINISLLLINALPVLGLDGGQALYEILRFKKSEEFAVSTVKIISFTTATVLFIAGMIICFKVRFNPSICLLALFLLVQTALNRMKYD